MKVVSFVLRHLFAIVGFLVAPIIFLVKSIYFHGNHFANKIAEDVYGKPDYTIFQHNQIKMSNCCNAPVRARMKKDGDIDFMYCDECKEKVNVDINEKQ